MTTAFTELRAAQISVQKSWGLPGDRERRIIATSPRKARCTGPGCPARHRRRPWTPPNGPGACGVDKRRLPRPGDPAGVGP
jgi:hypothetical protein